MSYNPWPLGNIPEELQRPELRQLKEAGYEFGDARDVIDIFEKKVAAFAGSKYAVAVDCCTHALELCFRYKLYIGKLKYGQNLIIPKNTYISVPQMLKQLGFNLEFRDIEWTYHYNILFANIIDSATVWDKGFFGQADFNCMSFQIKKPLCIGRGGMVLTNDKEAYEWLWLARYDGRDMSVPYDHPEHVRMMGYHYYMEPESAARGLLLMDKIKFRGSSADWSNYPDVSKYFK